MTVSANTIVDSIKFLFLVKFGQVDFGQHFVLVFEFEGMVKKLVFLVVLFLSVVREYVLERAVYFLHALLLEGFALLFHFLFYILLNKSRLFLVCGILK